MRRASVGRKRGALHREKFSADSPAAIERAVEVLGDQIDTIAGAALLEAGEPIDVTLAIGTNRIDHGLGRPVRFVFAIPATGNPMPGFDPAQESNPHPSRQVWLDSTVAGDYRLILL